MIINGMVIISGTRRSAHIQIDPGPISAMQVRLAARNRLQVEQLRD